MSDRRLIGTEDLYYLYADCREEVARLRAALDVANGERDTARQERDVCRAMRDGGLR